MIYRQRRCRISSQSSISDNRTVHTVIPEAGQLIIRLAEE
jgi:hypothetical protein